MSCTIKHRQGKFHRNKTCYNISNAEDKPNSKLLIQNDSYSVFTKKQTTWINSAIRNVKKEITNSGVISSLISGYRNTKVFIDVCK